MSISNFVPELWSSEILVNLWDEYVYAALCNRNYEGDIAKAGDTVNITSFGKPTINSYTKYTPLSYEQLDDDNKQLVIDQADSFSFHVDDIDRRQALGGFVGNAMLDAASGLASATDGFVSDLMYAAVNGGANDLGAIAADISNANALGDILVGFRTRLNRSNCPKTGRWLVVSPELTGALLQDNRIINAEKAADQGVALREGSLGRLIGFDLYESNVTPDPTASTYAVIAGHSLATTVADQIVETEALRLIDFFGDGLRGLHVYGGKVIRPEFLALASVTVQS